MLPMQAQGVLPPVQHRDHAVPQILWTLARLDALEDLEDSKAETVVGDDD